MIPWSRIFNCLLTVALLATLAYKSDTKKATATAKSSAEPSQINLFIPPLVDQRIGQTCGFVHQGLEACISAEFNSCREQGNAPDTCRNLDSFKECYAVHDALLVRMAENLCEQHMDQNDPCRPRVTPDRADLCEDDDSVPVDPCAPSPANSGGKALDLLARLRNQRRFDSTQSQRRIRPNFKFDR